MATVGQLASWAMGARPEVALPAAGPGVGGGEQVEPAGKVSGEVPPPAHSPLYCAVRSVQKATAYCTAPTVTLPPVERGVLLKTPRATRANPVSGLQELGFNPCSGSPPAPPPPPPPAPRPIFGLPFHLICAESSPTSDPVRRCVHRRLCGALLRDLSSVPCFRACPGFVFIHHMQENPLWNFD